jgi:mRNA interferase MazF
LGVRRGDLVTIALPGDDGKACPGLVIQSDLFDEHPSVTLLPVTSELRDAPLFRLRIDRSAEKGLRKASQIMVDKAHTLPREKARASFGRLDEGAMLAVNRALALFLGFA